MIARTWGGRVPVEHGDGFTKHLLDTGVADYHRQPGCHEVRLLRRDADGWASFLLISMWSDLAAVRAFARHATDAAVLYPGDESFRLVPDTTVMHYDVVSVECPSGDEAECAAVPAKQAAP